MRYQKNLLNNNIIILYNRLLDSSMIAVMLKMVQLLERHMKRYMLYYSILVPVIPKTFMTKLLPSYNSR